MLEDLKRLRKSITKEQRLTLGNILGDLKPLFIRALKSEDEAIAERRVAKFSAALKKEPMKAFKLYAKMTKEQKRIVQGFIEEDD